MRNHGETPGEAETEAGSGFAESITIGETVYNSDGEALGEIRGIAEGEFAVSTREGIQRLSVEHVRSGHEFGEAELVWRCIECGEVGKIDDGLPETCPGCGTEKENLMYWTED